MSAEHRRNPDSEENQRMTRGNARHAGGLILQSKHDAERERILVDLSATGKDIIRLESIVENLDAFIRDSLVEDRRKYRIDVRRFESILNHARNLKAVNEAKLEAL